MINSLPKQTDQAASTMPAAFRQVAILYHPKKPESVPLAEEIALALEDHGCTPWVVSGWEEAEIVGRAQKLDLLVTLGGDGTMLRAARMGARFGVPIVGVKMGRLGFLAEIQPEAWQAPLAQLLGGDYWVEERMMLDVAVVHDAAHEPHNHHYEALNDVVVSRGNLARMVRIATSLDEGYITTYAADGVIVATATGCTGYALAAGGPILPPELKNILLVPIAPHLSLDRALVLSQGATVHLKVYTDHQAILTVDGQFEVDLVSEDTVVVTASDSVARFVRLRNRNYFFRTLMERLRWNL